MGVGINPLGPIIVFCCPKNILGLFLQKIAAFFISTYFPPWSVVNGPGVCWNFLDNKILWYDRFQIFEASSDKRRLINAQVACWKHLGWILNVEDLSHFTTWSKPSVGSKPTILSTEEILVPKKKALQMQTKKTKTWTRWFKQSDLSI